MSLTVFTSNRMECLADALADSVRLPLPSPLTPEVIVVQSPGMERWLSMELAARLGVWGNCSYPYPNAFLAKLFRDAVPDLPDPSPFEPELLAWRIMGLLPALLGRPGFEPVRGYLAREEGSLKLFQLAVRIADTFDRYTLFRPDMLLGWEIGEGDGWQPELWRELVRACGGMHRARLREEFAARTVAGGVPLPQRIALFGISYLPPFHLDLLEAISRHCRVNLFLLNPCREYWGTILSEREQSRLARQGRRSDPEAGHLESGNALLASLGGTGRDFLDAVLERFGADVRDDFREEEGSTLLEIIRSDILELREPAEKRLTAADDRSLRVHSCHGPLRELEVLHDSFLEMFREDPTLTARDVLVMTPDMETYAPYISAVFDSGAGSSVRIPYAVADRSLRSQGHLADGLISVITLAGGRFGVNRVMDLLESHPVAKRFGFRPGDPERIRSWVEETGIRWGRDEADRLRHGAPGFRDNSWRAGLDRLLLGYALHDRGEGLFNGVLPFEGVEGDDARVLGALLAFYRALSDIADRVEKSRTLPEWEEFCGRILEEFFLVDEEGERERLELLEILSDLRDGAERAGFGEPVEAEVLLCWLESRLESRGRGAAGFLTGRVTFCAMLPMRSIPFRVIALIGMNDGAFPRRNRPPEFDLTAREPRRGDRSLRDEDRYLFLEALLSARERLHVSYTGRGMKENEEIPPSVLVSELLDYADKGFRTAEEGVPPRDLLVVHHRLHPFSPAYFIPGSPLFSYSEENREGAESLLAGGDPPGPFLSSPLAPPDEGTVSLEELAAFFTNPARAFLKGRFGFSPRDPEEGLAESEPFTLSPLEKYLLEDELADAVIRGVPAEEMLPLFRARGMLPAGKPGDEMFGNLAREVEEFASSLVPVLQSPLLPPVELDLAVGDFRLVGMVEGVREGGLLRYRCAKLKPKDRIRLWIGHLALNGLAGQGCPTTSMAAGKDARVRLGPVSRWRELLGFLLETRRRGMTEPLPFFPDTSFAYAEKALDGKTDAALKAARSKWHGSDAYPGEKRDPAFRLCFGQADPLDERFCALAVEIWGPLLEQCEKW